MTGQGAAVDRAGDGEKSKDHNTYIQLAEPPSEEQPMNKFPLCLLALVVAAGVGAAGEGAATTVLGRAGTGAVTTDFGGGGSAAGKGSSGTGVDLVLHVSPPSALSEEGQTTSEATKL